MLEFETIHSLFLHICMFLQRDGEYKLAESPKDYRNISPYLELLKDIILPRDKNVKAYLESFSIHDSGLILHNELIYIPEDLKIKLQILQSRHDSRISGHLGHEKILEPIIRDYC
jgi:hypothetical protein